MPCSSTPRDETNDTLWKKILPHDDDTPIYPAHDYKRRSHTTISEEKRTNEKLQLGRDGFIRALDALHPPTPDLFDIAVAKNSA